MNRETFLANLLRSGLPAPERLEQAIHRLPLAGTARALARGLVQEGLLTRFQAQMLLAGRVRGFLLGHYCILEPLGSGAVGHVYKARNLALQRVVALKLLARRWTNSEAGRALFEREIQAAARLIHPHIVTALDAGEAEGHSYLVMEYVEGQTLAELTRRRGALPIEQACDFIRQAALGLQCAHEQGVVHRDIKPSNLIVSRRDEGQRTKTATALAGGFGNPSWGVIKILDFGLARLREQQPGAKDSFTGEHRLMGTPDYLPPEQASDPHGVDIRSDLYSLGCTFYQLLTGRVPFPGGSIWEKIARHGMEEPVPVERRRPDVPAGVAAIVRRLMAKDRSARYQTPVDAAGALAPFSSGPGGARESPISPRPRRPSVSQPKK